MYIKTSAVAVTLLQIAGFVQAATSTTKSTSTASSTKFVLADYWKSFNSKVDPLNITIAKIPQTTSLDGATQCKWYEPPANFDFKESEWPNLWETATSNGMNETAEFKRVYNAIDWTKAPNIKVRKISSDGSLNMAGYDQNNDPDCWWSASTCTKPKQEGINEDIYTCPEPETWGLTYDDGPNCSHNAFYDYLEAEKIKASMFYIGSNVVNWPYGAQRGQKAGHHIADHTWSHQLMTTLTNTEVLAELYYTQKAIKMVTGVTPRHWRPAFGDVDNRVRWIATQLGLTTILWDLDTDDWAAGSTETVSTVKKTYEDFIAMGANGTFKNSGQITLTHEIDDTTMTLAMEFLPKIRKAYKNVLDVATCMNITNPYYEDNVVFAPFGAAAVSNTSSTASNTTASSTTIDITLPSASSASSAAVSAAPSATASSSVAAVAAVQNAESSAGIQLTSNSMIVAAFIVAAYLI
ncbi:chitin deacetylase 1 [Mucor mucedo]|uniref:chitin deacetylase 1 n=1 Tax=Mucor mucedo TaxID=29922 RepID=UPI00221E9CE1|nr:chitin deacetylase 1 [Mucor mucedo]KAI7890244.1 chitin deacetylase 1 [Mucor mucedo]